MAFVRRYVLLALAALTLWAAPGCNHEPDPIGAVDSGVDFGDAAVNVDAAGAIPDAGVPCHDAGPMDDAGPDAGADAGMPDAGLPDAGTPDAGVDAGMDADVPDAGIIVPCPDAG